MGLGSAILGFLGNPVTELIKRYVPDKNKQKEFDQEFRMTVLNAATEQGKDFAKRLIAEIQNPNFLRDAVRPIITYAAYGLYATVKAITVYVATKIYLPLILVLLKGNPETVHANLDKIKGLLKEFQAAVFTEFDFYLLLTILSFWFGGKLLERFTEKVTTAGGIRSLVFGSKE